MADNDVKIIIENNTELALKELDKKMPELLEATGIELYKHIYDFMTEDKVVDTGRLRGSISFSTPYNDYNNPIPANEEDDFIKNAKEKDTVTYGSNVYYASYVNDGTSKQRARKFIQIGTYRAVPKIKESLKKILKGEE